METLFPTFTQRLPKRKIPKKQQTSDSEAKKNEKNKPNVSKLKDTVQGWQCKTPLASGDVCKRTFFEKQHCIDHIKRDHTDGGGKICQVLVRKKKNNNSDNKKEQQQQQQSIKKEEKIEPIYKCRFCPGLYDTIDAFHEHVHSTHNLVWFAQLARKSRRRLSTATYLYHCRMCPMRTYRFGTLKSHLSAHTFHQQFRASLRLHRLPKAKTKPQPKTDKQTTTPLWCYFCDFPAKSDKQLLVHLGVEHGISADQVDGLYTSFSSS